MYWICSVLGVLFLTTALNAKSIDIDLSDVHPRLYIQECGPSQSVVEYDLTFKAPRKPFELTFHGGIRATSPLAMSLEAEGIIVDSTAVLWSRDSQEYLELRCTGGIEDELKIVPKGIKSWKEIWEQRYPQKWGYPVEIDGHLGMVFHLPTPLDSSQVGKKEMYSRPVPELPSDVNYIRTPRELQVLQHWVRRNIDPREISGIRFYCRGTSKRHIEAKLRFVTTQVYRKDGKPKYEYDVDANQISRVTATELACDTLLVFEEVILCSDGIQVNIEKPLHEEPGRRYSGRWRHPAQELHWGPLVDSFDEIPKRSLERKAGSGEFTVDSVAGIGEFLQSWTIRPVVGYFHFFERNTPTPNAFACYLMAEPEVRSDYTIQEVPLPSIDWYAFVNKFPDFPLKNREIKRQKGLYPCFLGSYDLGIRLGDCRDLDIVRTVEEVTVDEKTVYVLSLEFTSTSSQDYRFTWRERQNGNSWKILEANCTWKARAAHHALDIDVEVPSGGTSFVRIVLGQ